MIIPYRISDRCHYAVTIIHRRNKENYLIVTFSCRFLGTCVSLILAILFDTKVYLKVYCSNSLKPTIFLKKCALSTYVTFKYHSLKNVRVNMSTTVPALFKEKSRKSRKENNS